MQYSNPQAAFETAIYRGALCLNESHPLYVGDYMYMGDNEKGQHLFKHKATRAYLAPVPAQN